MLPFLHRWVTQRALRRRGFAPSVVHLVGETSRWTDWYRWSDNIANASTPLGPNGLPLDPDWAASACSALLRRYLARMEASPLNEQLVWLGFALHLAEDLASHQGRTDIEHTAQVFLIFPNPDWSLAGIRRGLTYGDRVLQAISQRLGARFAELQIGSGGRLLTRAEADALLGPRDFTWPNFWRTMLACRRYLRTPRHLRRVRWDCEQVLRNGLATS
ncbi:MAG: hypothetical protein HYZ09_00300 [Candidatus Kerfeldbacteria bacterium]|nr:hypothetical protein [Candidatus Kerfeldbacteria bacterium]